MEFICFALDAMLDALEACKRIEGLVNRNLRPPDLVELQMSRLQKLA
jgi:hypothetical protein